jgi:hypothetical protein
MKLMSLMQDVVNHARVELSCVLPCGFICSAIAISHLSKCSSYRININDICFALQASIRGTVHQTCAHPLINHGGRLRMTCLRLILPSVERVEICALARAGNRVQGMAMFYSMPAREVVKVARVSQFVFVEYGRQFIRQPRRVIHLKPQSDRRLLWLTRWFNGSTGN